MLFDEVTKVASSNNKILQRGVKNLKRILTIVLAAIFLLTCISYAFSDIENADQQLKDAVSTMTTFGILNGYEDGTFRPEREITRAEFAKVIIATMLTEETVGGDEARFEDVSDSHWAKDYIYLSRKLGIVNGVTETIFMPENNITYEQAVKMIVAALGYDAEAKQSGGYPAGYIAVATRLGITEGVSFKDADNATRANIVRMLNNALQIPYFVLQVVDGAVVTKLSDMTLYERHMARLAMTDTNDPSEKNQESVSKEENPIKDEAQQNNTTQDVVVSEDVQNSDATEELADIPFTLVDENGEEYDNVDLIDENYADEEASDIPMENAGELTYDEGISDYPIIPDSPDAIG